MGLKFATTTIDTTALYTPQQRGFGVGGIVGWSQEAEKNAPLFFRGTSEAKAEYGEESGLYRSIFSFFENRGKDTYGVAFEGIAQTQELFDGDVVTDLREFTLPYYPLPPLDVQADFGSGMAACTEGVEYDVDYGNKKVLFKQGYTPATGSGTVQVDGYATTPSLVSDALAELMRKEVQIVSLGYCYDPSILVELKDHLVEADSENSYRIGYSPLPKGEATEGVVDSLIASLECDFMGLIAHNSLKDPVSALCGITSYSPPQRPITFKEVRGLAQTEVFSNSEIYLLAGDGGRTTTGKNVIVIDNPERSTINTATGWGYTISGDVGLRYMDTVRVLQAVNFALEAGLTDPTIVGNEDVDITLTGIRRVKNRISGILLPYTIRPNRMFNAYKVVLPLETLLLNQNNLKESERQVIRSAVTTRAIDYEVEIDYRGSLNTIHGIVRVVPGGSS